MDFLSANSVFAVQNGKRIYRELRGKPVPHIISGERHITFSNISPTGPKSTTFLSYYQGSVPRPVLIFAT